MTYGKVRSRGAGCHFKHIGVLLQLCTATCTHDEELASQKSLCLVNVKSEKPLKPIQVGPRRTRITTAEGLPFCNLHSNQTYNHT